MNQLEKDLNELMKLITRDYWPSRSGLQNGYDAYSKFEFDGRTYFWKLESKDLNQQHKTNWNIIEEIEISDFAEKILQIMGRGDRKIYPDVFCIFIPHKHIGKNNTLREDLISWNLYNKFPFKIIVWDFDTLRSLLPHINSPCSSSIYPNAPQQNKSTHKKQLKDFKKLIKNESIEGRFFNRSYIRERDTKRDVWLENCLHVKVEKCISSEYGENHMARFITGRDIYYCSLSELSNFSISKFPKKKIHAEITVANTITTSTEATELFLPKRNDLIEEIDTIGHEKNIDSQKIKLIELFKKTKKQNTGIFKFLPKSINQHNLYNKLFSFCDNHSDGHVTFYFPREIQFTELPIRELSAHDFGINSNITFYMEFEDKII